MGRLDGQIVLVTGSGGGQGRGAAVRFAREGATVMLCDVKAEGLEETRKNIEDQGGESRAFAIDLTDGGEVTRMVDACVTEFGRLDAIFNNAGAAKFGDLLTFRYEDWRFTIEHELDSMFNVCRAAWPHLVRAGHGVILNTASGAGLMGTAYHPASAHAAAKGAVIALTRQLAAEGAALGIRVNSLSPGVILTPATEPHLSAPGSHLPIHLRNTPLGRYGTVDDIASAALFLISGESSWITGANLVVDGGMSSILSAR